LCEFFIEANTGEVIKVGNQIEKTIPRQAKVDCNK